MSVVRVGVIGVGMMGSAHATTLANRVDQAELVAVSDVDLESANRLAASLPGPVGVRSAEELIESDDIDAVVIAAPDRFHSPYTLACLELGKPALCEKPLGVDEREALAIVEAEVQLGRRLVQVGFMRVFDQAHRELHDLVVSGSLGSPVLFRGSHINPTMGGRTVTASMAINGILIHDLHSARHFIMQEIVEVDVKTYPSSEWTTMMICNLRFADGTLGVIEMNAEAKYGYSVDVAVVGTAATATTQSAGLVSTMSAGERREPVLTDYLTRFPQAYADELSAWVAAAAEGKVGGPDAWDGYAASAVAAACVKSAATGNATSVDLAQRPTLYETNRS